MTYSDEYADDTRLAAPPMSDGCPQCVFPGAVAPYATEPDAGSVTAFYRHRRCGYQWSTRWQAEAQGRAA